MIAVQYTAKVKESRLLELPEEALSLNLEPGQEIVIRLDQANTSSTKIIPNEKALAALRDIAEMKKGMQESDGSQTERIIREGRDGAMYGF